MRGLTVRQLEALSVTAEELHFGRAASQLGVSQPSLSQLIHRIEESVGARLFHRRPDVRLTEAGVLFLPQVHRALGALHSGLSGVGELASGSAGRLVIRFTSSALVSPFPGVLHSFRKAFPKIRVELMKSTSGLIASELNSGEIGVARHPDHDMPAGAKRLVEEPFVVALPPGHPLLADSVVPLDALKSESFVHFPRSESPALYDEIQRACGAVGFAPNVVLEATEWLSIMGLVRSGLGLAFVPASFETLKWGGADYRPLGEAAPMSSVVAFHGPYVSSPAVRHFMAVVGENR